MRPLKSIFGVIGVVAPVLYCGSLLYYFLDLSGSVQEAESIGLGPTVLILGAVGLLLSVPLIIKTTRLFARLRLPKSVETPAHEDVFDADAVVARYMARQSGDASHTPAPLPAPKASGSASRSSFGRRAR